MEPDYIIYMDGGCTANPGKLVVAAVVCWPNYDVLVELAREAGEGTNNIGEYRALRHAICMANLVGARRPVFVSDSMLVVQQVTSAWATKGDSSAPLVRERDHCQAALMRFDRWILTHVRRERNKRADWLASSLLGHARTLKKVPAIEPVEIKGEGRPGWPCLGAKERA